MKRLILLLSSLVATAAAASTNVVVGALAPEFAAVDSAGATNTLTELRGKWVVLYFYPRSFTPGCTAEACSLRNGFTAIQDLGAVILGVSLDGVKKQAKFKEEYHLPFAILSDADKTVSRAYDCLAVGGLFAKRRTFIITPEGKIAYIFENVKTATHDQEVLAQLKALQANRPPTNADGHR